MTITIRLKTNDAAFDEEPHRVAARLVRDVADLIEKEGLASALEAKRLFNAQGTFVGTVTLTGK